jgi:type IV secretion system protein VirB2
MLIVPDRSRFGETMEAKEVADLTSRWMRRGVAAGAAIWSSAALAQDSFGSDPAGSGVVVSAVRWLQGTLLGTVATVVAVIAIAAVGFLMLTGRINWRYGATVILGCFILFGAASIVAGIQSTTGMGG